MYVEMIDLIWPLTMPRNRASNISVDHSHTHRGELPGAPRQRTVTACRCTLQGYAPRSRFPSTSSPSSPAGAVMNVKLHDGGWSPVDRGGTGRPESRGGERCGEIGGGAVLGAGETRKRIGRVNI